MWVLEHMEDLDADFLTFYHLDGFEGLAAPRFFALALRTHAYSGVMAARASAAREQNGTESGPDGREAKQVESTREAVSADPALSGLISWGSSG